MIAPDATLDDLTLALRRDRATRFLLPLFLVSGATALVYQTVWARELHLVFGTSSFAITTVLTAFMAGLALGGLAMARWADRVAHPLRVYGWLEILIGAYAIAFPWILRAIEPVYLAFGRAWYPGPLAFALVQFVLVGAALLLPTAAMGATLPLLARFATDRLGAAGDRVGTLYGVNTAGAVVGTWLAGFVLLPGYGLSFTTFAAAFANIALGCGAIALASWTVGAERAHASNDLAPSALGPDGRLMAALAAFGGFSALVYEVVWTRALGLMLGGSVYAFSLMLLAFLIGIAAGGPIGGRLADQARAREGVAGVLRALAAVQLGVGVLSLGLMLLLPEMPFWYVWLFDALDGRHSPTAVWAVGMALAVMVMTPPAVLMGIAFPLYVRPVLEHTDELGGPVGRIYAANTLGSLVGAFVAGFVLLPSVGMQATITLAASANAVTAALAWLRSRGWPSPVGLVPLALALLWGGLELVRPTWDPLVVTAGTYHYVSMMRDHSRAGILAFTAGDYELRFYEEGMSSVVTVAHNEVTGNWWLANNGKVDASTRLDMSTQLLVALLPFQHTDGPQDVAVIGLASGITAGALTQIDDVRRIDIIELEPAIQRAARLFEPYNHAVLDDPRTTVFANDGRNQLLLTPPGTYDVIVNEPSNPWITGVSNLFTADFFAMGQTRLKPGGVWAQWVQMYAMDRRDLRSMLATFSSVYPYVLMYGSADDNDLVLLGSDRPLGIGPEPARHLLRWPGVREDLLGVGIRDEWGIVGRLLMDSDGVRAYVEGAPLNTDDNMRIEYSAPLNLHVRTSADNYETMVEFVTVPFDAVGDDPNDLAALAFVYAERLDWIRAITTMAAAVRLVPRDDPRWEAWVTIAEGWQGILEGSLKD